MTRFESKVRRTMYLTLALMIVPEILLSVVAARVFGGGSVAFFLALIGLICLYGFVWLRNAIWGWIMFAINRKQAADILRETLVALKLPKPKGGYRSIADYFTQVADDESEPVQTRIAAAMQLGTLNAPQARAFDRARASMLYEDALIAHGNARLDNSHA